jgi:hypothetical protein
MKEINWNKTAGIILVWEGVVAVAASVMVGGVINIMRGKLPPQIPLFYSLPWGEEQLAPPANMIWVSILIWIIFGLGWIASKLNKESVLNAFVTGAGLVSQTILVLGLVRIIMIIT